jgi:hypothetical protein
VAVYQRLGIELRSVKDPALTALADLCENYVAKLPEILNEAGASRSNVASGMEQGLRDMSFMLPQKPELRRACAAAFRSSVNAHYPDFFKKDEARLARVLARGRVRSESEWYLVRHRIDEIEGDKAHESDLAKLYKLVDEFEGAA